jgi:tetratricopeptide (TPR) repeat protein
MATPAAASTSDGIMTPQAKALDHSGLVVPLAFFAVPIFLFTIAVIPAWPQQSRPTPGKSQASPDVTQPGQPPLSVLAAQAQQALDRKDYESAIPLLQQLIAQKPDEALPHFELGYAYSELKRYDDAATAYRRAVELDPKLVPAHINLGLVLLDSDPDSALTSFRRAADLTPTDGRPHYFEGRALERGGKLPEAIEEYRSAAAMNLKDADIQMALASALLNAGKFSDAEKQFRKTMDLDPSAAPPKLGLAESLLREQKLQDAADAYAAYLAEMPGDREARFDHAAVLENLDRHEDALAELDRADQGADPTPQSLKLRGSIFMQQKKWPEADAALSKAAAALPNDAESHAWLGHAKMELRQYTPAQQELRRALEIDPSNIGPLRDLVGVLYLSGNYDATINAIDLLQQHDTLNALDWFFRAISCDKLGRKQEAADAYQKFLDLDHGQHADQGFQARGRLVVLLSELGKKKK